jgi:predicted kinase
MNTCVELHLSPEQKNMPTLTVLVGLPGSGKSSSIPNDFKGFVYSTDRYIDEVAAKSGLTYSDVFDDYIKIATSTMDRMLSEAISSGTDVVWDQTNLNSKKRRSILSRLPKNYKKVCICRVPPCNADEWAELNRRLASREGKNIPSHVIKSMTKSYTQPTLEEGFDEICFYDIYGNAF